MGRNRSVRITKKRSKNFIKNKTYRNKRGGVGGVFSSLGKTGASLKEILRYIGVVKSNEIFQSFTGCRDDCGQIILGIVNGNKNENDPIVECILPMLPSDRTLFCSTGASEIIQKLYHSINAKDKAKLYGILIKISEIQRFQTQIDELKQDTENKKKENQEKIDKITNDIKDLKTALDIDEIKKADRDGTKSYRENMNDRFMEKNVLLEKEIQEKKNRIEQLEKSNAAATAAAAASQSSSSIKDMVSSFIGPKPSGNERANTERDIIHRKNNKTIDDLKKDISVLQTEIEKNSSKIKNELPESSEDDDAKLSSLKADIAAKNIELKQANDKLAEIIEEFNVQLLQLTEQQKAAFGNINSGNSGNPVSGGRRTVWRRCPSRRRRHHRRRTNKIRKSRNGRKIQRN
jgi:hypothetical protein